MTTTLVKAKSDHFMNVGEINFFVNWRCHKLCTITEKFFVAAFTFEYNLRATLYTYELPKTVISLKGVCSFVCIFLKALKLQLALLCVQSIYGPNTRFCLPGMKDTTAKRQLLFNFSYYLTEKYSFLFFCFVLSFTFYGRKFLYEWMDAFQFLHNL